MLLALRLYTCVHSGARSGLEKMRLMEIWLLQQESLCFCFMAYLASYAVFYHKVMLFFPQSSPRNPFNPAYSVPSSSAVSATKFSSDLIYITGLNEVRMALSKVEVRVWLSSMSTTRVRLTELGHQLSQNVPRLFTSPFSQMSGLLPHPRWVLSYKTKANH